MIGALRRTSIVARIAIVVAVVALVAAVTVPPWVAHYQPVNVNVMFSSTGSVPQRTEVNDTVLSYRDNARIVLGMSVRNSGPFDATLTGYDDGPDAGVLKFVAIRTSSPARCCTWQTGRPAHFPLRIAAGTTIGLSIELRMTNCEDYGNVGDVGGGSVGYTELRFPMKTLGVHHVVAAPLASSEQIYIEMPGPLTRYCPRNRTSQP